MQILGKFTEYLEIILTRTEVPRQFEDPKVTGTEVLR